MWDTMRASVPAPCIYACMHSLTCCGLHTAGSLLLLSEESGVLPDHPDPCLLPAHQSQDTHGLGAVRAQGWQGGQQVPVALGQTWGSRAVDAVDVA